MGLCWHANSNHWNLFIKFCIDSGYIYDLISYMKLVCLVCLVPCYTFIKINTYTHRLVLLSGGLWKPWLTCKVTLIEIGPVYNDVSCKSIAGLFLLRYKTIKSRKWTTKKIFVVQLTRTKRTKSRHKSAVGIDIIWDLGHLVKYYHHLWSRPFIQHRINKQTTYRQSMNIVNACTLLRVFNVHLNHVLFHSSLRGR